MQTVLVLPHVAPDRLHKVRVELLAPHHQQHTTQRSGVPGKSQGMRRDYGLTREEEIQKDISEACKIMLLIQVMK